MEEEERCRGQDIVPAEHVRRMADKAASHKIVYSFWKWHDLRVMPFPLSSVHVAHARLGCDKNVWVFLNVIHQFDINRIKSYLSPDKGRFYGNFREVNIELQS